MQNFSNDQLAARKRRRLSCENNGPDNHNGFIGGDASSDLSMGQAQQTNGVYPSFPSRNSLGSSFSSCVAGMNLGHDESQCPYPSFEFTSPAMGTDSAQLLSQDRSTPNSTAAGGMQLQHPNAFSASPVYSTASSSSSGSNSPSSFSPSHPALLSIPSFEPAPYYSSSMMVTSNDPSSLSQSPRGRSANGSGGLLHNLSPPKLKGFQPGELISITQQQQQLQQQQAMQQQFGRRRSLSTARSYTAQVLEDNPNETIFPFPLFEDEDEYADTASLLAPQMGAWINPTSSLPGTLGSMHAANYAATGGASNNMPARQQTHSSSYGTMSTGASSSSSMSISASSTTPATPPPPSGSPFSYRPPNQSGTQPSLPMSLPVSVSMQSSSPSRVGTYFPSVAPVMQQQSRGAVRPTSVSGFKLPQDPAIGHYQPQMYAQQHQHQAMYPEQMYQQELLLQQQQQHQQQLQQQHQAQQQQLQQQPQAAVPTQGKKKTRGRKKDKGESMEENWKSVIAHTNTNNVQLQRSKWWWYIQSEKLRMTGPSTTSTTTAASTSPSSSTIAATTAAPVIAAPRGSCGEALGFPTSPGAVVNNKPGDTNKTVNGTGRKKGQAKKNGGGTQNGDEEAQSQQQQRRKLPARSKLHDLIEWVRNLDQAQAEQQVSPQELI